MKIVELVPVVLVLIITVGSLIAVSGIKTSISESIAAAGLTKTVIALLGACGVIVLFIASMWLLWGFGFY